MSERNDRAVELVEEWDQVWLTTLHPDAKLNLIRTIAAELRKQAERHKAELAVRDNQVTLLLQTNDKQLIELADLRARLAEAERHIANAIDALNPAEARRGMKTRKVETK